MKRIFKWAVGGLILLALVVLGGGMLMPSTVNVARDTLINAPADKIFPHVANLKAFNEWSPWAELDPDMVISFAGEDTGEGQIMTWDSKKDMGSGSMEVVEAIESETVVTALDFGKNGSATARFDLVPEGDATRVTWSMVSELGYNPIARWFGPLIKSEVEEHYTKGLVKLRQKVESQ